MKKWIIVLVGIILVATVVAIIFAMPKYKDKNDDNPVVENIEILCDDITMYLDDDPIKLNYNILNDYNLTYTKIITANNDCITLDKEYVIANKVGMANIKIEISTQNNKFTKNILVTVLEVECEIDLKIKNIFDQNVDKLFVGESYSLYVTINKKLNKDYQIIISENISNFELIECYNNISRFNFKVESLNNTKFVFKYFEIEKCLELKTYNYVTNIDVKIDNQIKDLINLYLFNNDYKDIANQDGLFNSCSFEILENLNCINEYYVEVSDVSVAKIENNSIFALKDGICNLIIYALDGSNFSKTIPIKVESIKIENLSFKDENIDLEINQEYSLNVSYNPIYAISDIKYYINDVLVDNLKVVFNVAGNYIIVAKDIISNLSANLVISVKDNKKYNFELSFSESFINEYNASFENDILIVNPQSNELEIYFVIKIQDCPYALDCNIEFSNMDIVSGYEQVANAIIINFNSKGETSVMLSLKENQEISYIFKIIIN